MNTTSHNFLFEAISPYLSIGREEPDAKDSIPDDYYKISSVDSCVRRLRGNKMETTDSLMNEFGAALQFFEGFGENWDSLNECLCYIDESLPAAAYALIITDAEHLLIDDRDEIGTFLKTMNAVGKFLAQPICDGDRFDRDALPFHVLLIFPSETSYTRRFTNQIRIACDTLNIPLREI